MKDVHSLSHTRWNCKYHIVFAPKYRRKVFYGEKKLEIGAILRELCKVERSQYNRSRSMPRPYTYASRDTTENECIKFYGISEREEQLDDL
jgi:putative transposase